MATEREEARRHLRAEHHDSNLQKAVKMAGNNLRKVRKAAVLSFFWNFVRKLKTRTREGDQAGREARPQLGVRQRREWRTPEGR